MGMIETLWAYISGKPSEVARSSTGGAGAVKPPTLDIKFEDGIPPYTTHSVDDVPNTRTENTQDDFAQEGSDN